MLVIEFGELYDVSPLVAGEYPAVLKIDRLRFRLGEGNDVDGFLNIINKINSNATKCIIVKSDDFL